MYKLSIRIFCLVVLIIFSPLLISIYILLFLIEGSPVIYKSQRLGKNGREFILYKFRTMTKNDVISERSITHLGKYLRRSSIDELPQLFNIIKGEMAIVGPRPLPSSSYQTKRMKKLKMRRLSVLPGLTGLSQISTKGKPRSADEKIVYDIKYIKEKSLLIDVYIIFMTLHTIYRRFIINKTGETL